MLRPKRLCAAAATQLITHNGSQTRFSICWHSVTVVLYKTLTGLENTFISTGECRRPSAVGIIREVSVCRDFGWGCLLWSQQACDPDLNKGGAGVLFLYMTWHLILMTDKKWAGLLGLWYIRWKKYSSLCFIVNFHIFTFWHILSDYIGRQWCHLLPECDVH